MNATHSDVLRDIFTDSRCQQLGRWLRYGVIDGRRVGAVIATLNPGFTDYALNKAEEERLLAAKDKGKIEEAHVVFARIDGFYKPSFSGARDAEELHQKILAMGLRPRPGRFGEFYTLPSILTASDDDPM
jgi:hypothetical protein